MKPPPTPDRGSVCSGRLPVRTVRRLQAAAVRNPIACVRIGPQCIAIADHLINLLGGLQ